MYQLPHYRRPKYAVAALAGLLFLASMGSAQALSSINGQLRGAVSGQPIANVRVFAISSRGGTAVQAETDVAGRFRLEGLAEGVYFVRTAARDGWVNELWGGQTCPLQPDLGCDPTTGLPVRLAADQDLEGIHFELERGFVIRGRVAAMDTGEPRAVGEELKVWNGEGILLRSFAIAEDGRFDGGDLPIEGLSPGHYLLTVDNDGPYLGQVYGGGSCRQAPDQFCDLGSGSLIEASNGQSVEKNFALIRGGAVEGTVTAEIDGRPLSASITIYDQQRERVTAVETSAGGFRFEGLASGNHFVTASIGNNAVEAWLDQPCSVVGCLPAASAPIPVQNGEVTGGIDFQFAESGEIRGRLTAGSDPLNSRLFVVLWDQNGRQINFRNASSNNGEFSFSVGPGTFFLTAAMIGQPASLELAEELFDDAG